MEDTIYCINCSWDKTRTMQCKYDGMKVKIISSSTSGTVTVESIDDGKRLIAHKDNLKPYREPKERKNS